jgi:sterol 3beta-glucosyltransferase
MRMGTQTLIQALTAIPWTEDPDNEDDALPYDQGVLSDQEYDDDDRLGWSSEIFGVFPG